MIYYRIENIFFFFNDNQNKTPLNLNNGLVKKLNDRTLKNRFFFYYSIICPFPYFRQNSCYFSIKFFNDFSFNNFTKRSLQKLEKIQKQILLLIFEPLWEASFEISSYSNRRGRSLYDVIEFLRLNLKHQPLFFFKTYLIFVNKNIYKSKKQKNIKNCIKLNFFCNKKKNIDIFLIFFCFFENIFFHGIQKKYQNFYLITKQQILLYKIIKLFKQNIKNKISFYKIIFNNKFIVLSIQNKIFLKLNKKILSNNIFLFNFKNIKVNIQYYKNFILQYSINNNFSYEHKVNIFLKYFITNLKSKNFLIKNFLIFSLCYFFFDKMKNLKQRLFLLELKKHCFSFFLQKIFLTFVPIKNHFLHKEGLSFSIILKDSNFFVSKNTFLFFIKNKKVFFETKILSKWDNKQSSFYKRSQKNNIILVKRIKYQVNNFNEKNKFPYLFFHLSKIHRIQFNYKLLLKILIYFLYGYYDSLNKFINFSFFYNIFINFSFFIKEVFVFYKKKSCQKIFFIIHYFSFYGKFISFFKYNLQKIFVIYLLKRNDIEVVWNSFLKYERIFFFFNSNYTFLKSFKTILQKSLIINRIFLFFYIKKNNNILPSKQFKINLKSVTFFYNDLLISYLKIFFYSIMLNNFIFKNFFLKYEKKKKIIYYKYYFFKILWSVKLFRIKIKHSFFYDKKNFNGFSFFNFFIYHTNKNKKNFYFNCLFFWQFYYLQILLTFDYIQSFSTYYQIWQFRNKKILLWKNKQLKKIVLFYFYQFVTLEDTFLILWKFKKIIKIFINFPFIWQKQLGFSLLFKLIYSKIFKDKHLLIFYKKLIQQENLKIFYYFFIKPSKDQIQKHLFEIYNIIRNNSNKNQVYILFKLSKIIKNWCFYYQILTPTRLYKYIDYLTLQILWKWACKRHYKKSKKWIKLKYFYKFNFIYNKLRRDYFQKCFKRSSKNQIVFAYQRKSYFIKNFKNAQKILFKQLYTLALAFSINKIYKKMFICLPNHMDIILVKHQLIQNDRSPYDIDFTYWIHRNH